MSKYNSNLSCTLAAGSILILATVATGKILILATKAVHI
jgi:hypothetical protein